MKLLLPVLLVLVNPPEHDESRYSRESAHQAEPAIPPAVQFSTADHCDLDFAEKAGLCHLITTCDMRLVTCQNVDWYYYHSCISSWCCSDKVVT